MVSDESTHNLEGCLYYSPMQYRLNLLRVTNQSLVREIMRLLSYNIHKGIGGRDRRYLIHRIMEVIESENPDLICLQEVDREVRRSKNHDQPRLLAESFNAEEKLFQLNVRLKNGGYGNLILSRWRFRSHHQISLRMNRKKQRGAQLVVVETPEGLLLEGGCS